MSVPPPLPEALFRPSIVNEAGFSLLPPKRLDVPLSGGDSAETVQLGRKSEIEGEERGVVDEVYSCR